MTRHLTDLELERYRGRTLPPQQLLSANAHLQNCNSCHERYGGDRHLREAFALAQNLRGTSVDEAHLSFEQLAAYVDDALRGEEQFMAVAHLKECAECTEQVRELEPLRALITNERALITDESYPTAVPAPPPVRQSTLFDKLRAAWQVPAYRTAAQVAVVVIAVALLGWLVARSLGTDEHIPPAPAERASAVSPQPAPSNETASDPTPTILTLEDGDARVTLDEQGHASGLESLSPAYQRLVKTVLTTARVETQRMPWDGRKSDTLMGGSGDESFTLQSPVGKVVETTRPTFRWMPLEGATSYVVTVRDSTTQTIVTSTPVSYAEWSVPHPLRRGVIYSWKVLAVKNDKEFVSPPPAAPDAQFKVLEEAQAQELERARQRHPRFRLLLGALYARAGLLNEAEREFRELVKKNPGSSFAQKLLRDVRARRSAI